MLRLSLAALLFIVATGAVGASCKSTADTLCTPGENLFCRCRGGGDGTKTCRADGKSFDVCVNDLGPCNEVPTTSVTTATSGGGATATGTQTGSTGTGGQGSSALFTPCKTNAECKSGDCRNHYCTLDCGNYLDCVDGNITGDCVRFAAGTIQICAPYCTTQSDCAQYGATSACGGAKALDNPSITFAVCGDWGTDLGPMPPGSSCATDPDCNLGLTGMESICVLQKCATGCYLQSDCPNGKFCSSGNGAPGTCG
jgi:hypothetical protein